MDSEALLALGYVAFLAATACALVVIAGRMDKAAAAHVVPTWPKSEEAQLRRGLALTILVLASVLLATQMIRHPHRREVGVLTTGLLACAAAGWRAAKALRRARARVNRSNDR